MKELKISETGLGGLDLALTTSLSLICVQHALLSFGSTCGARSDSPSIACGTSPYDSSCRASSRTSSITSANGYSCGGSSYATIPQTKFRGKS
jgi:hypothetical protein